MSTAGKYMAVDTETSAVIYSGNGSAVTPYPVPFPYLAVEDVWAQRKPSGGDDFVTLDRSLFDVVPAGVVTDTAYAAGDQIRVFRQMAFLQDAIYPTNGTFSTEEHERALDRLCMLIQQLRRDILGSGEVTGGALQDVASWANTAARGSVIPTRKGQLGVQLDNLSLWVAASTGVGDWDPVVTGTASATDSRLCLALIADCGQPGGGQTAVAARLTAMAPDWVLDAGDTSYNAGNPADWAAFLPWITPQKYLRVRGNHSIDTTGEINADAAAFGYLGTNPYWYSKVLGNGLVEIFAIDVGRTTAGAFLSPGYSSVGSAQHTWFAAAIAASTARHKLVLLHQPPVTSAGGSSDYCLELDWPELSKADAIFAGHTHLGDWITWRGTPVINLSGAVRMDGASSYVSNGAPGGQVLWVNDTEPLIGRLWITPVDVVVEAINTETGRVEFARSIYEKGPRAVQLGGWTHPIGTAVDVGAFLAVPANCTRIHSVLFSFGTASPEWSVELTSDGESVTPPVFCDGTVKLGGSDILFPLIPPGSGLRIEVIPPHPSEYSPPAPATGLYVHIIGDTLS